DAYVAVSQFAASYWRGEMGIPPDKKHLGALGGKIEGGGTPTRPPRGPLTGGVLAAGAPGKGPPLLVRADIPPPRGPGFGGAALEAAGYLAPEHRSYLRTIEKQMTDAGFGGEFCYRGELDRVNKVEFLRNLDIFSVPCIYDEPKGISVLEAMATGVPVVQP